MLLLDETKLAGVRTPSLITPKISNLISASDSEGTSMYRNREWQTDAERWWQRMWLNKRSEHVGYCKKKNKCRGSFSLPLLKCKCHSTHWAPSPAAAHSAAFVVPMSFQSRRPFFTAHSDNNTNTTGIRERNRQTRRKGLRIEKLLRSTAVQSRKRKKWNTGKRLFEGRFIVLYMTNWLTPCMVNTVSLSCGLYHLFF